MKFTQRIYDVFVPCMHHHAFEARLKSTLANAHAKVHSICTNYGLHMPEAQLRKSESMNAFCDAAPTTRQTFYADASKQLLNWLDISRWMKAAPFTKIHGALATIHSDLEQLKAVEKGVKDMTVELLLHECAYTHDTRDFRN